MSRLIFFGLLLSLYATQHVADEAQSNIPAIQRETHDALGWTLHINTELLTREPKATKLAITLLKKQLAEIVRDVPEPAVVELKKGAALFLPKLSGRPDRSGVSPECAVAAQTRTRSGDGKVDRVYEYPDL